MTNNSPTLDSIILCLSEWHAGVMSSMKAAMAEIESDSDSGFSSTSPTSDRSLSPTDVDPVSNKIIEEHSERRKIDENTDAICKDKKATINVQILTESAEKSNLVTVEDSKNYSTQSLNKTDQKLQLNCALCEPNNTKMMYCPTNGFYDSGKDESLGEMEKDRVTRIREMWRQMDPIVWKYLQKLTIDHCISKDEAVQKTEDVLVIPSNVFVELLQYAKIWNEHRCQGMTPPVPKCQYMQEIPDSVVKFFVEILRLRYGQLGELPNIDNKNTPIILP
ncbi:hypothetical protein CRE_28499 [Caenorhabditis remanei]|uniref:Uncharacterized protein n=1 Tax=Caenorhabditis remanei TaxID=31234 RepID=E3LMS9_CAERE|nr:hypothetical protein CRE_28499 [Caenorhabditis remanei]